MTEWQTVPVEDGWAFMSADFSVQAAGNRAAPGNVTLVRDAPNKARWLKMPDEAKEDDDGPPLYVIGRGLTFHEALVNANLLAAHAIPILPEAE